MATKDDILHQAVSPITFVQAGRVQEIAFEPDMSIAQALRAIGVDVQRGQEIRLNNRLVTDKDTTLQPGDQLLVVGNISGG